MAKFLTTAAVTYNVERIIVESKKKLVLVSPYIKITKTFLERLKDASDRKVQIIIIYGKTELNNTEKKQLDSIAALKLYYIDNLHAKCYFNEKEMVITSMNLYEFSERNNREMGIFVTKKEDVDIFYDAVNETHSIIKSATLIASINAIVNEEGFKNIQTVGVIGGKQVNDLLSNEKQLLIPIVGYCLRCKDHIKMDVSKPYCEDCFSNWVYWSNPYYEENFCHSCGNDYESSVNKPSCVFCDRKLTLKNNSENDKTRNSLLPLSSDSIEFVSQIFGNLFPESKINCTNAYVYCKDLLKCGDVMFREGIEFRLKFNLVRKDEFIDIIDSVIFEHATYEYVKHIGGDSKSPHLLFIPQNVENIHDLTADFEFILQLIDAQCKYVSRKQIQSLF